MVEIMKKEILDSLFDYIDRKVEYEFASREEDEEGYTSSCADERKVMELAKQKVIDMNH